jgi:UDP-N-acetyl-D-galactosamine dehydrogenase
LGYIPQVILSGRQVNNSIAPFIADKVVKLMIRKNHQIQGANVLILGVTFKENCPDIRNTKVVDIYYELREFGVKADIFDPWVNRKELKEKYGVNLLKEINQDKHYSAIILAVAHDEFRTIDFEKYHNHNTVIFDAKDVVDRRLVDGRL